MPDKKEFIIFVLLCLMALGLDYWYGMPDKPSEERAEAGTPPAPTIVTNVVKEVVTNTVAANPQPTPAPAKPRPQPTPTNIVPANTQNAIVEKEIREELNKPQGELTKADLEKVKRLELAGNQLTEVPKDLEDLTKLTSLSLDNNQLADVKGLEKLTQLTYLELGNNRLTDVKGLENLKQLKELDLDGNELTDVKGLEKLTQLRTLWLRENKLSDVKGLEKFAQLTSLYLINNPDLTKAQIAALQKALPKCRIYSNPKK